MILAALLPPLALLLFTPAQKPQPEKPRLKLELVSADFSLPTFLCSDPGDASRLFVLEQAGRLRVLENGELRKNDFIDLRHKVNAQSERGLLCMAFHPHFPEQPWVFLHYSDLSGNTCISRFTVDLKTWTADPLSEVPILQLEQPWSNHNGGMIAFGPRDGFLYIGLGDGGAGNDPRDVGQDGSQLLAKILRIDVDHGHPYAIPESNPFVGNDCFRDEIWAYGLRNPWRFCFDPVNGDLYIGDVGQNKWEEIDWQAGSSSGGENYGWRIQEGTHSFKDSAHKVEHPVVEPIHEYGHSRGHCSVTGGYVYRGDSIPWLQGQYFYADYCSGDVGTLKVKNGVVVERINRTAELTTETSLHTLVSFGVDADQEMYILCSDGRLFRIVPR